jgi:hypothetical protein
MAIPIPFNYTFRICGDFIKKGRGVEAIPILQDLFSSTKFSNAVKSRPILLACSTTLLLEICHQIDAAERWQVQDLARMTQYVSDLLACEVDLLFMADRAVVYSSYLTDKLLQTPGA